MNDRNPFDGRPFYCVTCGAGFDEYMACEDVQCELEPASEALHRLEKDTEEQALREGW